jgi:Electron transfer DM13
MLLTVLLAIVLAVLIAGAALFQPWRLFTSSSVDEPLPLSSSASAPSHAAGFPAPAAAGPPTSAVTASAVTTATGPTSAVTAPPADAAPRVLAAGEFQSQEHATSGTASLVGLPDGSRVVRLENLAGSDGPDVRVWLSGLGAGGDWFKYRSGPYLDLGPLRATHGNQNYIVPPGADLTGLGTVVLWCDRFSVAFGSAALS